MELRTYELEKFMDFLMSFELQGKNSRLRTRFVRILNEYLNRFNQEHQDLILQFSNKDDNGEPVLIDMGDGRKKYDVEDAVGFNKQYNILLNEKIIIEETKEREEILELIKDIILNCDKTFKGEEAFMYDRYCEIVETINVV